LQEGGMMIDFATRFVKAVKSIIVNTLHTMNIFSRRSTPQVSSQTYKQIHTALKKQLKQQSQTHQHLTPREKELVQRIRRQAAADNRNNVTRTKAYWEIYRRNPELHWAFLAHMVSRNGGWNMTDLQGEWIPKLLTPTQAENTFEFLESCNSFIFHDAYPQLLLYEESKKINASLFRLLPHLHVSSFMEPIWDLFWKDRDSVLLTVAMIINEQNYIQGRVVENEYFKKHVLQKAFFRAQSLFQLNHVIFPYIADNERFSPNPRLAGLVVEDFAELDERIEVGKKLYAMLFGLPDVLKGAERFAEQQPHSGSRADYWPHLFAKIKKSPPSGDYALRLNGCGLEQGAPPVYSPELANAWKNRELRAPERYDWFQNINTAEYLRRIKLPVSFEITDEYCFGLHKIELAVAAGQLLEREE
jgi:hypothetical protein